MKHKNIVHTSQNQKHLKKPFRTTKKGKYFKNRKMTLTQDHNKIRKKKTSSGLPLGQREIILWERCRGDSICTGEEAEDSIYTIVWQSTQSAPGEMLQGERSFWEKEKSFEPHVGWQRGEEKERNKYERGHRNCI